MLQRRERKEKKKWRWGVKHPEDFAGDVEYVCLCWGKKGSEESEERKAGELEKGGQRRELTERLRDGEIDGM